MSNTTESGSIFSAMLWMLFISILLFWLPLLGPLLAGIVGGMKAGGVMAALVAAILPSVFLGVGVLFITTFFTGQLAFGFIAGLGSITLSVSIIGPLIIGAIIGAILNQS